MNVFFMKVRDYLYEKFQRMTLITSYPEAAWYFFIDFKHYHDEINIKHRVYNDNNIINEEYLKIHMI